MFFYLKQLRQVMFSKVSASASHKLFNDSIKESEFPQNVKLAELQPS